MPRRARRGAAFVASLLLVPALGACGGFDAPTDQVYQPAVGDNVRGESVSALGAVVLSTSDGTGTFSGALVNSDLEEGITLTAITGEEVEVMLSEPVVIPPDSLVDLTPTGNAYVSGEPIVPGANIGLALEFDDGQVLEMEVPVVDDEGVFAEITEAEPPGGSSPGPTPSTTPSATPGSGTTESAAP